MTPIEMEAWIEKATLEELVMNAIWTSVMEGTAHCGWTDRARDGFVNNVQERIKWCFERKAAKLESENK